eukprot:PITA_31399
MSSAQTRIRKMQSLLRNPFSRRKNNNKSTELPPASEIQQQHLTTLLEMDAEQQLQDSDEEGRGDSIEETLQDSDEEGRGDSIEETLVRIPGEAVVHLVEAGEEVSDSVQLGSGEFSIVRLVQGNTGIALLVKVGEDVCWPLTKDEPTLKLDSLHYLFSIRPPPDEEEVADEDKAEERENDKDRCEILNYGVTFADEEGLDSLDSFLEQHACLSLPAESNSGTPARDSHCTCISRWKRLNPRLGNSEGAYWTALAPRVEDYNSVVAKAIAAGSGQIIKGLFLCSNAYTSQVRKGGEFVRSRVKKATDADDHEKKKSSQAKISPRTKKSIRRVKKLSRMTEKLSENVLAGLITVSGAVTAPVVGSKAGQKFFRMLPGDVLLASLDAFNQILEAAELAGKDALSATSEVTVDIISHRFGEDAGQVTSDTLAVGGHAMGTAWNVFKIRKTIDPVTNGRVSASALKVVKLKKTSDAIRTASKNLR